METSASYTREVVAALGSYRTYEEWKQNRYFRLCHRKTGSYRTYEEWKHGSVGGAMLPFLKVLTVPMRNGNLLRIPDVRT